MSCNAGATRGSRDMNDFALCFMTVPKTKWELSRSPGLNPEATKMPDAKATSYPQIDLADAKVMKLIKHQLLSFKS